MHYPFIKSSFFKACGALFVFAILLPFAGRAQYVPQYTINTVAGTYVSPTATTQPTCPSTSDGDGGSAAAAQLCGPAGLLFDSSGNLYIADVNNERVRKISNGSISTVAGNGTPGFAGNGTSPTASGTELNSPTGLAFDTHANLYIADSGNYSIREIANGEIIQFAGQDVAGFLGDFGIATSAEMFNPTGVAVDASGNVYIADPGNNTVRVVCETQTPIACTTNSFGSVTWVPGDINTFAGNAAEGAQYSGDGGLATGALLNNPTDVKFDQAGNLYIVDSGNNAVRMVNTAGVITTLAGNGQPGYSGDGGLATKAMLSSPKTVAIDSNGNVFIADYVNSVIRMVTPDGIINTIAGNGSAGYGGDGGPATSAQMFFPAGLAIYGGNIYVSDSQNNVIRELTPVVQTPAVNAGGVINGASYTAPVAPGSIASVFGDFFLPTAVVAGSVPLSTDLSDLSFTIGSTPAPLFFVSSGQANVQVPWEVTGQTTANITPTLFETTGSPQSVNIAAYAPAIFSINTQGTGPGAILDSNYNLVSSANPATPGTTVILIYCTGLGPVSNQPATGAPAPTGGPFSETPTTPTVTIGGVPSTDVSYSGLAPGFVGLYQVNALVPAGLTSSDSTSVTITIGGVTSNTVTIAVN